ncbi:MAG: hypothetical protein EOM91_20625 [Sphingobacteriia bacterium]|nr:hypothetical protein [Sphingobacteriia bacterium]
MRYSNHWHYLPASVQEQARARWPSGVRAAGPGDWYQYEYEMVEFGPGYQLSVLPAVSADQTPWSARLVGRKAVKPAAPVAHAFRRR